MEKLRETAKKFNIELSDKQLEAFNKYYEMLIEKNKVMNLTAITEKDEVIVKHFADSLALAQYYDFNQKIKVIDVGTGAGFPGIPLKIAFPKLRVTLFDSLNKRIVFLQEVIDELGLKDIEAIHGRAEEGGKNPALREQFDLVVSRAVANMAVLSEYCIPFARIGGKFIPYKSGAIEGELRDAKKAITVLGGKYEKTEKLLLPGTDMGRSFVFIKKIKKTGKAFPRKAGTASKQPLM